MAKSKEARDRAYKKWSAKNPEKRKLYALKAQLKHKYGLTIDVYENMRLVQEDRCAICYTRFSGRSKTCVDHDHSTGMVRGLLCGACNTGLGQFRDDTLRLKQAIAYLEKQGAQNA